MRWILLCILLSGCAASLHGEQSCSATITVHVAGGYRQSGSYAVRNGCRATARPATGDIWITGERFGDGIVPDSVEDLGHEVLHILHRECPQIANPDN